MHYQHTSHHNESSVHHSSEQGFGLVQGYGKASLNLCYQELISQVSYTGNFQLDGHFADNCSKNQLFPEKTFPASSLHLPFIPNIVLRIVHLDVQRDESHFNGNAAGK